MNGLVSGNAQQPRGDLRLSFIRLGGFPYGHHHVGHIGILGVDKQGAEFYQISIGGAQGNEAALGKVLGPSVSQEEVPDFVEKLIATYLQRRDSEAERFIDVVRRIGIEPFREQVYGNTDQKRKHRSRQLAAA